jgi:outer membrane immunogenic protein
MPVQKNYLTRVLAVIGSLGATTSIAGAADMPTPAPVLKAPPMAQYRAVDWSGFYLGGHGGYGSAQVRGDYDDAGDNGAFDFPIDGAVAGGQAGYLWQFGRAVYGIEIDGSWANLKGSRIDDDDRTQEFKTNFLGSVRLRTGIAIDNVLLYSTVGIAYGRSALTVTGDDPSPAKQQLRNWGVVGGLGAEWAFAPNWSVRAEYLYYGFDTFGGGGKDISNLADDSDATDRVKLDGIHVGRVALNYRFNGSGGSATMSAPVTNWAGFYVGANAGYVRSRITGTYNEPGDYGTFDKNPWGFSGGGHIGYNFQSGAWVYGLEGDASWSNADRNRRADTEVEQILKTNAFASVRGRLGLSADNMLFYLTAGVGYVRSEIEVVDNGARGKQSFERWGPVIGAGTEWRFAQNWSARVESLTFLGSRRINLPDFAIESSGRDFVRQSTVTVARAGLTYHFPVANVVAKY